MGLSPRDMSFVEAKNSSARDIALAIGVPPLLLGLPGDNTHANYAEANKAFYRQTVLPLVSNLCRAWSGWLAPAFGQGLSIVPDVDALPVFADERAAAWGRIETSSVLTVNEKRAALGFAPIAGGDVLLVPNTLVAFGKEGEGPAAGASENGAGPGEGAAVAAPAGRAMVAESAAGDRDGAAVAAADATADADYERTFKYRPDQPRVPAGRPDGGQWTREGGAGAPSGSVPGTSAIGLGLRIPRIALGPEDVSEANQSGIRVADLASDVASYRFPWEGEGLSGPSGNRPSSDEVQFAGGPRTYGKKPLDPADLYQEPSLLDLPGKPILKPNPLLGIEEPAATPGSPAGEAAGAAEAEGSGPNAANAYNISTAGMTPEERDAVIEYARRTNVWLAKNGPITVQPTAGALRSEATEAARLERLRAARAGTPYQGQVGHAPDTAITGAPNPPGGWVDMPGTSNNVIGGGLSSRIGRPISVITVDGKIP